MCNHCKMAMSTIGDLLFHVEQIRKLSMYGDEFLHEIARHHEAIAEIRDRYNKERGNLK